MEPIHIVLAVDPGCVLGCAVSIRSIMDNASAGIALRFHVITNGVSAEDRRALTASAAATDRKVDVLFSEFNATSVTHLIRSKLITHTAYARFFIDDLLPVDVHRCVYVDCDVAFERDVSELWRIDLDGHTAAAVPNGSHEETVAYQRRLGLREPAYFNSGVLLIDMDRWRARRVAARALAAAARVGDDLILHDQDALNCALEGDWLPLEWYWNVWVIHPALRPGDPAVLHYMGAPKPWHADYDRPFGDRFHVYLDRTEFRGRRPWNPAGLGARFARMRRRLPYMPTVLRLVRRSMDRKAGQPEVLAR